MQSNMGSIDARMRGYELGVNRPGLYQDTMVSCQLPATFEKSTLSRQRTVHGLASQLYSNRPCIN